jgi:2-oxoglutarate ferredoxin oxidoreductase subunit beta
VSGEATSCDTASCVPSYIAQETLPYPFCPGCGHTKVAGYIDEALKALGRPPGKVVVVTDIGCVGLTDRHFATNGFHGLHGRSITYASGIKLADPDLTVVVVMGDGGTGIGGAHLLAAARRNIGITVIVANNFNYGMTGGQHSSTTPLGGITSTTLKGNLEMPLDLMGTLRPMKPAFLGRTTVFSPDAADIVTRAVAADGFALVDVWDLCVAYYAGQNTLSRDSIGQMMDDLEMPPGVHYEGSRWPTRRGCATCPPSRAWLRWPAARSFGAPTS